MEKPSSSNFLRKVAAILRSLRVSVGKLDKPFKTDPFRPNERDPFRRLKLTPVRQGKLTPFANLKCPPEKSSGSCTDSFLEQGFCLAFR